MPRKVRDSNLETRTARARLKVAHKPYVRLIEPGLHLGYRKLASGPGTWLARRYNGGGKYAVENLRTPDGALIIADDYSEADGHSVLSFGQAQERAKARRRAAGKDSGPYKVADAMDAYLAWLESEGRSDTAVADARYRDRAFIRPKLGEVEVASLTADKLRQWRDALAKAAPRLRTRAGEKQKHRDMENNEEARRSRRASANRTWTTLRAALNHAFHHTDKIDSDKVWRKVKPFKSVDKARVRYLTVAEAKRLINGSDPEFRPLLQASLLTGGRYSQVVQLTASDFNADAGTLRMRTRKGNGSERIHHVHLTAEGIRFFESASAGRAGADLIFNKEDGSAWGKSHQARPMREAVGRAKIKPAIGFHGLRHTWASHAVMNGVPLMVVAKNLGHSDTRMVEKHYGHLAPSYIADAIRAGAPRFGIEMDTRVAPIRAQMMFDRYTDEQWEAIVAACRDKRFTRSAVPVKVDWTKVRATLEKDGRRFCHRRGKRPRVGIRELRSLRQKIQYIKALEAEPDLPQSVAWDLALWRQQLEDTEKQFDFYRSKDFRGRADLHREILYANFLRVWTKQLGGEPKFSRNDRGNGPCVRFLTAALGPILGTDTPKPEGFAGIIKRERDGSYKGMWFLDYGLSDVTSDN